MNDSPRIGWWSGLGLALVLLLAGGTRGWYVWRATDGGAYAPIWQVQGKGPALDESLGGVSSEELLVRRLVEEGQFATVAPLSDHEEPTAHLAPGYYCLRAWLARLGIEAGSFLWLQVGLSVLSVLFLVLFVRRGFDHPGVTLAAGVLAALHPFWIVNAAETGDGTLSTFLLCLALYLGTRGGQVGGYVTALLFGLCLAGLALVRAEMLPFVLLALVWFIHRCRLLQHGWLFALLALLGFANGVGPWTFHNFQLLGEPIPLVDSAYVHLYVGNNPQADGGPMDESALRASLPPEKRQALLAETERQARRYALLGRLAHQFIREEPGRAVALRLESGVKFLCGDHWWRTQKMVAGSAEYSPFRGERVPSTEAIHQGSLLVLLVLAFVGWRLSQCRAEAHRLASLALLLIPLPYVLTHAESLVGPRLPWDALLICFSAYALAGWLPRGSSERPS